VPPAACIADQPEGASKSRTLCAGPDILFPIPPIALFHRTLYLGACGSVPVVSIQSGAAYLETAFEHPYRRLWLVASAQSPELRFSEDSCIALSRLSKPLPVNSKLSGVAPMAVARACDPQPV